MATESETSRMYEKIARLPKEHILSLLIGFIDEYSYDDDITDYMIAKDLLLPDKAYYG